MDVLAKSIQDLMNVLAYFALISVFNISSFFGSSYKLGYRIIVYHQSN